MVELAMPVEQRARPGVVARPPRLVEGRRFDPEIEHARDVATVLDAIYSRKP